MAAAPSSSAIRARQSNIPLPAAACWDAQLEASQKCKAKSWGPRAVRHCLAELARWRNGFCIFHATARDLTPQSRAADAENYGDRLQYPSSGQEHPSPQASPAEEDFMPTQRL